MPATQVTRHVFGRGWANVFVADWDPSVHTVPIRDSSPHQMSAACACRPRLTDGKTALLVHNSWDGREIFERALYGAFGRHGMN